jgi:16S rRNA (guanine527-N7)-methyltransferase
MVARHVLDSLTALPFLRGERVLDVGCGAGLPGFPLAFALPSTAFVLLDSNAKKQRFVEHVCRTLQLSNVQAAHTRVEDFAPECLFDTIICRALTTLNDFATDSGHLLQAGGRLLAMKGRLPDTELSALGGGWEVTAVHQVQVPMLLAERHIVEMQKAQT